MVYDKKLGSTWTPGKCFRCFKKPRLTESNYCRPCEQERAEEQVKAWEAARAAGWEVVYPPVGTKARVTTFGGKIVTIDVTKLVLFKGNPERVYGPRDKFKMDEEPFEVFYEHPEA